jgi:hypothetical protein
MPTSTNHNNYVKPDPLEAGKTVTYNGNWDKAEAGKTIRGTASVSISAYQGVRYNRSTDRWTTALDTDIGRRGIAQAAVSNGATGYFQVDGVIINLSWTWTIGDLIYFSNSGAGTLTATKPTPWSRPIGVALTATSLWIFKNDHNDESWFTWAGRTIATTLATGATEYLIASGPHQAPITTEADAEIYIGRACTIKRLSVRLLTAPGTSNTRRFTVRVNGANSSPLIQFDITGTGQTGAASADVSLAIGDRVTIQSAIQAGTPAASHVQWALELMETVGAA